MATGATHRSLVGARLNALRSAAGLTAAQLAEAAPASGITKTVITNVESGRKRDLTVTELLQIASALGVSPLALIVDTDRPWERIKVPGMSEGDAQLSNIEYAMRAGLLRAPGGFDAVDSELIEALTTAERRLANLDAAVLPRNDMSDGGAAWRNQLQRELMQALGALAFVRRVRSIPPELSDRVHAIETRASEVRQTEEFSAAAADSDQ